jgi:hypothetical protein
VKTSFKRSHPVTTAFGRWVGAFGFNPLAFLTACRGLPRYVRDYKRLRRELKGLWAMSPSQPCMGNWFGQAGAASGHYFHQDFYVARRIHERKPIKHVDVGSRIDGFVAHVASFRILEVFDIRPLAGRLPNVVFRQADFSRLQTVPRDYCDSLSCLHAVEHFGLGRYGDAIDGDGWKKGILCLSATLQTGGILYLSTPIGRQRVEFNGQRVFSPRTIVSCAEACGLELESFSYVDDSGDFHEGNDLSAVDLASGLHLEYGCGIFEFRKRGATGHPPAGSELEASSEK